MKKNIITIERKDGKKIRFVVIGELKELTEDINEIILDFKGGLFEDYTHHEPKKDLKKISVNDDVIYSEKLESEDLPVPIVILREKLERKLLEKINDVLENQDNDLYSLTELYKELKDI